MFISALNTWSGLLQHKLQHQWGVAWKRSVCGTAEALLNLQLVWIVLIFLLEISHRFQMGFRSDILAGQSSPVIIMLSKPLGCGFWQCGQVPSPAGKWNLHLHKACQQKEAWSAVKCPGRWLRWLWTSENTMDHHQQMTWQPKSSLTVETSHWTSSNMDSVSLLSSSRLWDLDLQMKYNIHFYLKRGLWTTEQQSGSFSP